ncbi:hypothetical protein EVAR_92600_1 [Eumeta japonica]|uniref:Uncharacterized protein n=1 Tax=Eumeta variegata TaxID=151549 RepID=A0A4C1SWK4_EUMVA|nr:hypothetical protein EVAR_92600_1 [Eumeta japonica]
MSERNQKLELNHLLTLGRDARSRLGRDLRHRPRSDDASVGCEPSRTVGRRSRVGAAPPATAALFNVRKRTVLTPRTQQTVYHHRLLVLVRVGGGGCRRRVVVEGVGDVAALRRVERRYRVEARTVFAPRFLPSEVVLREGALVELTGRGDRIFGLAVPLEPLEVLAGEVGEAVRRGSGRR